MEHYWNGEDFTVNQMVFDVRWAPFYLDLLWILQFTGILNSHLASSILEILQMSQHSRQSLREDWNPWEWLLAFSVIDSDA